MGHSLPMPVQDFQIYCYLSLIFVSFALSYLILFVCGFVPQIFVVKFERGLYSWFNLKKLAFGLIIFLIFKMFSILWFQGFFKWLVLIGSFHIPLDFKILINTFKVRYYFTILPSLHCSNFDLYFFIIYHSIIFTTEKLDSISIRTKKIDFCIYGSVIFFILIFA